MFTAIAAIVLPILKKILPTILMKIVERIFNPPTPEEKAKARLDKAIVKGDLMELTKTTQLIIDKSEQDKITAKNVEHLKKLVE